MNDPLTQQCAFCLDGDFCHEYDALCFETHTPWKNCGEECCVDPKV